MKSDAKVRTIVLTLFLALCLVAACSVDQMGRRSARITATPTKTPRPTFTTSPTATLTLTPSPTPLPSDTPSPVPTVTNTPPPTATPTVLPSPTNTLPPPPTATRTTAPTRRPAPKPTKTSTPRPTNTPAPPFVGNIVRGFANCGWTGVEGLVKHSNKTPYPDVAVGIWSDLWYGIVTVSEPSGKYSLPLVGLPPGKFRVAVVELSTCSGPEGQPTAVDCQRRSNVVEITTTIKCSGTGASNVTIIDFTGP